jgi:hypothetical protein
MACCRPECAKPVVVIITVDKVNKAAMCEDEYKAWLEGEGPRARVALSDFFFRQEKEVLNDKR